MGPIGPCCDYDMLRKEKMYYISEEIWGVFQEKCSVWVKLYVTSLTIKIQLHWPETETCLLESASERWLLFDRCCVQKLLAI